MEVLSSDVSLGTARLEATLLPGSSGFILHITGRDEQERASFVFTREFPVPAVAAEYLERHANTLALAYSTPLSTASIRSVANFLVSFGRIIRGGSPADHRARMEASVPTRAVDDEVVIFQGGPNGGYKTLKTR